MYDQNAGTERFSRWLKKHDPNNFDIIFPIFELLLNKMNCSGYVLTKREVFAPGNTMINNLLFVKNESNFVFYISIIFDKTGSLKFLVNFAKRCKDEPFIFERIGLFVKRNTESIGAQWWGARWYSLNKEAAFRRDWAKFVESIPSIVKFIETGERGRNMFVQRG